MHNNCETVLIPHAIIVPSKSIVVASLLTSHVGGVEGVEGEGEDVLSVATPPQFGPCVSVPEDDIVRGVDGQQEVTRCILVPQPLQV